MGKLADEARAALESAREDAKQAWAAFDEARTKATEHEGELAAEQVEELDAKHQEYEAKSSVAEAAQGRWEKFVSIEGSGVRRNGDADLEAESKRGGELVLRREQLPAVQSPGARFVESEAFKAMMASGAARTERGRVSMAPVEVWTQEQAKRFGDPERKAAGIIHTGTDPTGGFLVLPDRSPDVVDLPGIWPRTLLPYIPRSTTASDTIEWVQVATFTNAAAPVAQAVDLATGLKPQSDLTLAVVQSPVQTIAHWIAATRQALQDAPRLRDLIDNYLGVGIELTLEQQVLNGNGTAPNLRGILATPGINAAPAGASVVESIFGGIGMVLADGYQPNLIVMNPADFAAVRLAKDTTGNYFYGPPSIAGPATMWGLSILQTPRLAAGSALVGDFRQATLWVREGVVVQASSEHADFFIRNLVAILAEGRWAFGVMAPGAFASVDLTP